MAEWRAAREHRFGRRGVVLGKGDGQAPAGVVGVDDQHSIRPHAAEGKPTADEVV